MMSSLSPLYPNYCLAGSIPPPYSKKKESHYVSFIQTVIEFRRLIWGLENRRVPVEEDMVVFTHEDVEERVIQKNTDVPEKKVGNLYTVYKIPTRATYF